LNENTEIRHDIKGLNANPVYGAGLEDCSLILPEEYIIEKRQIMRITRKASFME
jgi:hypothetical protein